jgi:aminoglycoside phosphotransferase
MHKEEGQQILRLSAEHALISEGGVIERILYRHYSLTGIMERVRENIGEENLLDEEEANRVAVEATRQVQAERHRQKTMVANLPNLSQVPRRGYLK